MRIGIYGGSFDPVHNGHINAAKTFMKELSLDKIIIVPAYCSPFKKGLAVTPSQHRLNMCNIAFGALPDFEVSNIEILREDEGYMSDTIAEIREIYPKDELFCFLAATSFLFLKSGTHGAKSLTKPPLRLRQETGKRIPPWKLKQRCCAAWAHRLLLFPLT